MIVKLIRNHSFKVLCLLVSALYFWLFMQLVFTPVEMLGFLRAPEMDIVHVLARRVSGLMLSFSVLLFLVRNARASAMRAAICVAVAVNMAVFASTGLYEFSRGAAEPDVFAPVVIEILSVVLFGIVAVSDYRKCRAGKPV